MERPAPAFVHHDHYLLVSTSLMGISCLRNAIPCGHAWPLWSLAIFQLIFGLQNSVGKNTRRDLVLADIRNTFSAPGPTRKWHKIRMENGQRHETKEVLHKWIMSEQCLSLWNLKRHRCKSRNPVRFLANHKHHERVWLWKQSPCSNICLDVSCDCSKCRLFLTCSKRLGRRKKNETWKSYIEPMKWKTVHGQVLSGPTIWPFLRRVWS